MVARVRPPVRIRPSIAGPVAAAPGKLTAVGSGDLSALRDSAAVVLTRGQGAELEVLLVQRSPRLRFFGGAWAFPGGVRDEADGPPEEDATWARCALRELFEESGVLPAALAGAGAGERARVRAALNADPPDAEPWRALLARVPDALAGCTPVCTLVTPPFALVRHRTRFRHLALPDGESVQVITGELVDGRFFRPAELLEAWSAGALAVAPPTLRLVELLGEHGLPDALARAREHSERVAAGALPTVAPAPGVLVVPLATPTLPPATTTNCYLVGERALWIVDPATWERAERARLFAFLDALVAGGRRFAGVLVTHHHRDHVGSVAAVAERYRLAVHAHAETLARLALGALPRRALADGDELPLGRAPDGSDGWRLRVLFTPGHAPGHLAFVESRLRTAIVGDLVSTLSTIVIDPPEGHLATYLASLRRLVDERIGVLLPAHGMAAREGVRVVEGYLAHRAAREKKLVAALGERPRSVAELVPEVYADTAPALHPLAARSLLAGLQKLAEEGRAVAAGNEWRARAEDERTTAERGSRSG